MSIHDNNLHWIPLTTSTQVLLANNVLLSQHHLIEYNVKMFDYNEHPDTTSPFFATN